MLSRSVHGVLPDLQRPRVAGNNSGQPQARAAQKPASVEQYEKTISTIENPAQTPARVPEPYFQEKRPGDPAQPATGGAQAFDPGLTTEMGAETPGRLRFGCGARLKDGRDFARVRQEGTRLACGCLIANWRRLAPGNPTRLGVVTARSVGSAVERSRARRLLRESFRLHQHDLVGPVELVLVARPSIAGKGFAQVEKDFLTMLRKTGLLEGRNG